MPKLVRNLFALILSLNLMIGMVVAQSGRVRSRDDKRSGGISGTRNNSPLERANSPQLIPKGTIIELKLDQSLSSKTNNKGDEFSITVAEPVFVNDRLILSPGALVKCQLINVQSAGRKGRNGSITIGFNELILDDGRPLRLFATLVSVANRKDDVIDEDGEGKVKQPSKGKNVPVRVATSTGVGAAVGAISGIGAAIGAGIGAGAAIGSVLVAKGQDVELLSGSLLQVRLDADLLISNAGTPKAETPLPEKKEGEKQVDAPKSDDKDKQE